MITNYINFKKIHIGYEQWHTFLYETKTVYTWAAILSYTKLVSFPNHYKSVSLSSTKLVVNISYQLYLFK